jgi:hypothetical protein
MIDGTSRQRIATPFSVQLIHFYFLTRRQLFIFELNSTVIERKLHLKKGFECKSNKCSFLGLSWLHGTENVMWREEPSPKMLANFEFE